MPEEANRLPPIVPMESLIAASGEESSTESILSSVQGMDDPNLGEIAAHPDALQIVSDLKETVIQTDKVMRGHQSFGGNYKGHKEFKAAEQKHEAALKALGEIRFFADRRFSALDKATGPIRNRFRRASSNQKLMREKAQLQGLLAEATFSKVDLPAKDQVVPRGATQEGHEKLLSMRVKKMKLGLVAAENKTGTSALKAKFSGLNRTWGFKAGSLKPSETAKKVLLLSKQIPKPPEKTAQPTLGKRNAMPLAKSGELKRIPTPRPPGPPVTERKVTVQTPAEEGIFDKVANWFGELFDGIKT